MNTCSRILILLVVGCLVSHISAVLELTYQNGPDFRAMKAEVGEYPHQVFILLNNVIGFCGGAIIDKIHILTVASCLFDIEGIPINASEINVYIGRNKNFDFDLKYAIRKIAIHENFTVSKTTKSGFGNIAMLTLMEEIEFNDMVKPIKLPTAKFLNKRVLVSVSGFSAIDRSRNVPYHRLQFPQLTMFFKDCFDFWKNRPSDNLEINKGHLCARSVLGPSTCYGDNGNGLIRITGEKEKTLIALSTSSDRCGKDNSPDVYILVWNYLDWINGVLE